MQNIHPLLWVHREKTVRRNISHCVGLRLWFDFELFWACLIQQFYRPTVMSLELTASYFCDSQLINTADLLNSSSHTTQMFPHQKSSHALVDVKLNQRFLSAWLCSATDHWSLLSGFNREPQSLTGKWEVLAEQNFSILHIEVSISVRVVGLQFTWRRKTRRWRISTMLRNCSVLFMWVKSSGKLKKGF